LIKQGGQDGQENVKIFISNARANWRKLRIKYDCKMQKMQKIVKNLQKLQKMRAI
jgi:hypothetical protein